MDHDSKEMETCKQDMAILLFRLCKCPKCSQWREWMNTGFLAGEAPSIEGTDGGGAALLVKL